MSEWHSVTESQATGLLEVDSAHGLNEADVVARREKHGANRLSVQPGRGPLVRFLAQIVRKRPTDPH